MQIRETLEEAGYVFVCSLEDDHVLVRDTTTSPNKLEVFFKHDTCASWTLVIDGIGYEFVRQATSTDILNAFEE